MKRRRVHISVNNLNDSIRLGSGMSGVRIFVTKPDYPKWTLDDPCLNLAISRRGKATGQNRPGIQAGSEGGFAGKQSRISALHPGIGKAEGAARCDAGPGIASETSGIPTPFPCLANLRGGMCLSRHAALRWQKYRSSQITPAA